MVTGNSVKNTKQRFSSFVGHSLVLCKMVAIALDMSLYPKQEGVAEGNV